ncbi:MAG: NAD(P)H-dependent oxidoreductase [Verrucomicrobia bacterium]|nr:NAD(P)H-dependent oxidoreductase [Verrucomicrobiota bacterium]
MTPIAPSQLIAALQWRYAVKRFDASQKIPTDIWAALEETLVLTPSSYGLQPWKFIVVQDAALRESLVPHSWGQRQVADASHLVVLAVQKKLSIEHVDRFLQSTATTRGIAVDSLAAYRKMMVGDVIEGERSKVAFEWATRQAYIALGNFMTSAALLGIDTCPMEGFVPAKYDEILGLEPRGLSVAVLCPTGYRAANDKYAALAKVRFPKQEIIEHR